MINVCASTIPIKTLQYIKNMKGHRADIIMETKVGFCLFNDSIKWQEKEVNNYGVNYEDNIFLTSEVTESLIIKICILKLNAYKSS